MKRIRVGVGLIAFALASVAYAKGLASLKGQIIVSDQDLPVLDDEDKMVAELKRLNKPILEKPKGTEIWAFTMMGFLGKKPGTSTLTLLFYDTSGGKRTYVTSKEISCDPNGTILKANVEVSEEDGVKPGSKMDIDLAKIVGEKQIDFAKAKLTFK